MVYDLGDTVGLAANLRDSAGQLANATSLTLTITRPDGTSETPAVTNPPTVTGQYTLDYVPALPGRYTVRWAFATPTASYADTFDVAPADPGYLVSLADAKAELNIPATRTSDDAELRGFVAAATSVVEQYVGAVVRRSVTQVMASPTWRTSVALSIAPVLSVQSLTLLLDGSAPVDVTSLDIDADAGILRVTDGTAFPAGPWRITYTAGREQIPPNIRLAALIIIEHLWKTQRGSGGLPSMASEQGYAQTGLGFAIPYRAMTLLEPDQQAWGFA